MQDICQAGRETILEISSGVLSVCAVQYERGAESEADKKRDDRGRQRLADCDDRVWFRLLAVFRVGGNAKGKACL